MEKFLKQENILNS